YLSAKERKKALVLSRALKTVEGSIRNGTLRADELADTARRVFAEEPEVRVDYIAVVNPETLAAVDDVSKGGLIAVAAYVGSTRLIDNVLIGPRK
ncbi:MAG TPA: pantoate--beta-alanine ligase, partial [Terriglobales bacterium]